MTKNQLRLSVLEQIYRVHISSHSDADSLRVQSSDPPARLGVVCACASLAGVRGAAVNKGGQEHDVLAPRSQIPELRLLGHLDQVWDPVWQAGRAGGAV